MSVYVRLLSRRSKNFKNLDIYFTFVCLCVRTEQTKEIKEWCPSKIEIQESFILHVKVKFLKILFYHITFFVINVYCLQLFHFVFRL